MPPELVVAAERAGLTQTQLRSLFRTVQDAYQSLRNMEMPEGSEED